MTCVICKHGETNMGRVTVALERDGTTLILKSVPAQVCDNCGESYVDAETAAKLLHDAEEANKAGVEVEVRAYAAA